MSSASEGRSDHPPGESGGACGGMAPTATVGSASRRSRASYSNGALVVCPAGPRVADRSGSTHNREHGDTTPRNPFSQTDSRWHGGTGARGVRSTGAKDGRTTHLSTHISPCSPLALPSHLSKPSPIREPPFPSTFVKTSSESAVCAACGPRMMSASWATMKRAGS